MNGIVSVLNGFCGAGKEHMMPLPSFATYEGKSRNEGGGGEERGGDGGGSEQRSRSRGKKIFMLGMLR